MARKGNPISVRLDLNRSSDSKKGGSLYLRLMISLYFVISQQSISGFLSYLPLLRKVSFTKNILSVVDLILKLLLFHLVFGLVYLFMNELQQAVAQFYPASGGMGGFNLPPGPSENSWLLTTDELPRGLEVGEGGQEVGEVEVPQPDPETLRLKREIVHLRLVP